MTLRDLSADAVGISWAEWHEQQAERIFAEAREQRRAAQTAKQATQENTPYHEQPAALEEQLLLSR